MNPDDGRDPASRSSWLQGALARVALLASTRTLASHAGAEAGRGDAAGTVDGDADEEDLPDPDDPLQRAFGPYTLLARIGRGGMGVVYRAHESALEREVALKLLPAGAWASSAYIDALRREACHAARLQHPGIVTVFGTGEHEGRPYYAMELVAGVSLAERLDSEGPLPSRVAAALVRTVAEAVDYAHRLGVLHLDLKPGNVLLSRDGTPKVADFGLARRIGLDGSGGQHGGTPGYMAPEQHDRAPGALDRTTDVWGIGGILYEALSGRPPRIERDSAPHAAPPMPSTFRPGVPADLDAICMHCLQPRQTQRYPTARAVADDLGRHLENRELSVRPLGAWARLRRWARREPRLAAAIAIAAIALVAGSTFSVIERNRAERNAMQAREHLWSARLDDAWRSIEAGLPIDALPELLANLDEQQQHDRAAAVNTRLRIAALLRQSPAPVDVVRVGEELLASTFVQDGRAFVVATGKALHLYGTDDGRLRWRSDLQRSTGSFWGAMRVGELRPTTDGRHLIAGNTTADPVIFPSGQDQVLVALADGRPRIPPAHVVPRFRDATASPDGSVLLARSEDDWAQLLDTTTWRALGPRRRFSAQGPTWMLASRGRHVLMASQAFARIDLWDGPSLRPRLHWTTGFAQRASAWALSGDEDTLAVGRHDGTVALHDLHDGGRRVLQDRCHARIRHLGFDREGRWLGAVCEDGTLLLWDFATLRLLARPLVMPTHRRLLQTTPRLHLDPSRRRVFASNGSHAFVYAIPAEANEPPSLIATRPPHHGVRGDGNSWWPATDLLLSAGLEGEARLWRLPAPVASWPAAAASRPLPLAASHAAAARGDAAWVVDRRSGHALSRPFAHEGDVAHAALLDADTLATVSGTRLQVRDWRSGTARGPAVELPSSPVQLVPLADAGAALVVWGEQHAGRYFDVVARIDTRRGRVSARRSIAGPQASWAMSPDRRAIAFWRQDLLHVLDTATLAPMRPSQRFRPDMEAAARRAPGNRGASVRGDLQGTPIRDVAFDPDGRSLWVLNQAGQLDHSQPARLRRIALATPEVLAAHPVPTDVTRIVPIDRGQRLLLHSADAAPRVLDSRDGAIRHLLRPDGHARSAGAAASADGRRAALARARDIVVLDHQGQWLTPLLTAELAPADRFRHVLLSDDDGLVQAQSMLGRTFVWDLRVPDRADGAWRRYLDWLATSGTEPPADAALRRYLRAQGEALAAAMPAPPTAQTVPPRPGVARPARDPRFLDLSTRCNYPGPDPDEFSDPQLSPPRGPLRLLGREFHFDCAIAASMLYAGMGDAPPYPTEVTGLVPGLPRFAAIDLLVTGHTRLRVRETLPFGQTVLHYRDGGSAQLPLYYRRDLWEWWFDSSDRSHAQPAYVPFALIDTLELREHVYVTRLHNPFPQREVARIDWKAIDTAWSGPLLFAATLVPEQATPPRTVDAGPGVR